MTWRLDGLSTGRAVAVTVAVVATLVVLAASLQRRRRKRMPMDVGQQQPPVLSEEQVQQFLRDGVLVVPGILTPEEVAATREGLHTFLRTRHGVEVEDLDRTASSLRDLSSTNGSGGVLNIYYPPWKLRLVQHEKIFRVLSELWAASYATADHPDFTHPYGAFDPSQGFAYIDRVGFRVPSTVAKRFSTKAAQKPSHSSDADPLGDPVGKAGKAGKANKADKARMPGNGIGAKARGRRKKSARPLQRSLTPHLDCCPASLYQEVQGSKAVRKWRPIQAFVALTDTAERNMGGFECARGFHRLFHRWAATRSSQANGDPAPCVGEFTPIRPKEDGDVLAMIDHVPCCAGSLVLWDWRIPHANARENEGQGAREVVYVGFLPQTALNRGYAQDQLASYQAQRPPLDQWHHGLASPAPAPAAPPTITTEPPVAAEGHTGLSTSTPDKATPLGEPPQEDFEDDFSFAFSPLGRRLMAMEDWLPG